MQMKQPAWESTPVLDVRKLSRHLIARLAKHYDALAKQQLDPLARLNSDAVRRAIDKVIADAVQAPDFSHIRELLDREPGMNARDIIPWSTEADEPSDPEESDQSEMAI